MTIPARELLTIWHPFFDRVNDNTQVFEIGPCIAVIHVHLRIPSLREAVSIRNPELLKEIKLALYQPNELANPAAYCETCNTLWIRKVIDVEAQRKIPLPNFRGRESSTTASKQSGPGEKLAGTDGGKGQKR